MFIKKFHFYKYTISRVSLYDNLSNRLVRNKFGPLILYCALMAVVPSRTQLLQVRNIEPEENVFVLDELFTTWTLPAPWFVVETLCCLRSRRCIWRTPVIVFSGVWFFTSGLVSPYRVTT